MTKKKDSAEKAIRDIRRATRRQYSAEEKIRIVLEGLRGESSIAELCRKEGINQNLYYRWSKEFPEAGKKRLADDTAREANSDEVKGLRREAAQLKEALAETVLDDYSRCILAWKLCDGMTARDVSDTLSLALESSGLDQARVRYRPRLLSDNGPSYVSAELRDWLEGQGMGHTRGAPYHPMTQGKIERWHRSMKNQVLLENYYLPGELKARIGAFVDYYNTKRYHESLSNLTPEDVYTGRGQTVVNRRRRIKQKTLSERRRLYYRQKAA